MLNAAVLTKVARIDTGLCFEQGFIEKADGFAREFGLQRIELQGGTAVAKGCYERAKSSLAARHGSAPPDAGTRSLNSKGRLAAMLAEYDTLEDGSYVATVLGLQGVIAVGDALEECRMDLIEVIEEWIVARLQWGYTIPPIGGHFG